MIMNYILQVYKARSRHVKTKEEMAIWEKMTPEDTSDQESDGEKNFLIIKTVRWRKSEEQMLIDTLDERRGFSCSRPCLLHKQGSPSKCVKSYSS